MTESQPRTTGSGPLRPVLFILILCAAVLAVVGVSKWRTGPELVPWQTDFTAAQAQARAANKPVLLYFTAEWCGPCQEMRRSVWTDQQVADAASRFIPVRIDVDQQPELARQYNIIAMPTFFQLSADGRKGREQTGAMDAEQTIAWLKPAG